MRQAWYPSIGTIVIHIEVVSRLVFFILPVCRSAPSRCNPVLLCVLVSAVFSENIVNLSTYNELCARRWYEKATPCSTHCMWESSTQTQSHGCTYRTRYRHFPSKKLEKLAISRGKIFIPKTYTEDSSV